MSIPYGQRFIEIEFERQDLIVFVAPGNLFLRFTVEQAVSAGGAQGTAAALDVEDVSRWITKTPTLASSSTIDTQQRVLNTELYINNIFVNPEVHDIFIRRIGFSLIRVHRQQSFRLTAATQEVLLSNLKWPIETLYIGMRPAVNISAANPNQPRDWHRFTLLTDEIISIPATSESEVMTDPAVAWNAVDSSHKYNSSEVVSKRVTYPVSTPTLTTVQLQAHGIDIYRQTATPFFSSYQPFTFGGSNINTPEDDGALMLNMCLYPGTYQPSGHINVSRAREFYLQYTSGYVDSNSPADLVVVATALNFLLISDGSAVLRYST